MGVGVQRLLIGCLSLTGCTVLLKTDEQQCSVDADCAERGGALAGTVCRANVCVPPPDTTWSCVGKAPPAPLEYQATVLVVDLITRRPPTSGTIKLCTAFDNDCRGPILEMPVPPDGLVTTTIRPTTSGTNSAFAGFFFFESPGFLPTLSFVSPNAPIPTPMTVLTPDAALALNRSFPTQPAPESGSLSITAIDCNNAPAVGVRFTIDSNDPATVGWYATESTVSTRLTATGVGGVGGFSNLKEGPVNVTAILEATGQVVATAPAIVKPRGLTYLRTYPTRRAQ